MKAIERLRQIMHERGLTQADVARMCDIHTSLMNEIYHGKRKTLGMNTLIKLSRGLGVSIDNLVFGEQSRDDIEYINLVREFEERGISIEHMKEFLEWLRKIKL
ncbi:MAG: helix-turn-helix transcriptional regulator [Firmicutes bacterium]|nr:helix-turn-helix transcriptional regulator [Bacillota bacterium]